MFGRIECFSQTKEQQKIGVAGVFHGSGTTFCTMMMAYFMKKVKKQHTVVVEQNVSGHLLRLSERREASDIRGIDIYGSDKKEAAEQENRYSCLFFDYGTKIRTGGGIMPEFCGCSKKIITAGLCLWREEELLRFVQTWSEVSGNEEFIYLLPFAPPREVKRAEKKLHRRMYAIAAQPYWYRICPENLSVLEEIFC